MKRRTDSSGVWAMPILLGVLSAVGLVAALLSSGLGDWISWVALAVPVIVSFWWSLKPNRNAG